MRTKFFAYLTTIFFLSIIITVPSCAQSGCTDPLATNYDPSATTNDGKCTYNTTAYTPPVKVDPMNDILVESSGLQMAGNSLWSFNDGGGAAAIYRIDTESKTLFQTVNLENATNVDWEDIAFDGTYFYVGDFGNNENGGRTDLKIYKFALSDIPGYVGNAVVTIPKEKIGIISFKYSNQPNPVPSIGNRNNTKFDCEAMIVDKGKIHLFSKNWINLNTTHYVISSLDVGSYTADSLETLQTNYLLTGADKAPGQNIVAFIGYQPPPSGLHFMHLLSDYTGDLYFSGNKRRLDLPGAVEMGQAEAIAFDNNAQGYISNERVSFLSTTISTQKLRSFDISSYVTLTANVLPLNFTIAKAWQRNEGVEVDWKVNTKTGISYFEVEKSKDGKHFIKVQVVNGDADNSYKWFDAIPYNDDNFYRIKIVGKSGDIKYSSIMHIKIGNARSSIDVFPNPINSKTVTVRLTNQNEGAYTVRLFNNAGQQLYSAIISHQGGSATETLQLGSAIIKGVYQLQISNGASTVLKKVVGE